jgi:tRNA-modifying protein YgfZ
MTEPFVFDVPRDVVVVEGPDATSFLQSLVSQDLEPVGVGENVRALLLQPQGKLVADFQTVHADTDCWWLVTERGYGAVLADGLKRFKIRVKAEVRDASPEFGAFVTNEPIAETAHCALVLRPIGTEVVGPVNDVATARARVDAGEIDAAAYERLRIAGGVPRLGVDVDDKTIPQEAGLEADAVSFTKGCFLGQELVCRIDTRGHVNRYLRRLRVVHANGTLPKGADVSYDGRVVGTVTSSVGDLALAMVRHEVGIGAMVQVGATDAVVEGLQPG